MYIILIILILNTVSKAVENDYDYDYVGFTNINMT